MLTKAVWVKKRRREKKRLSQLHYALTWPCTPCCALQAQAGTGVSRGVGLLLRQSREMCPAPAV